MNEAPRVGRTPILPTAVDGEPGAVTDRLHGAAVPVPDELVRRLEDSGAEVRTGPEALVAAARDWWPVSIGWAAHGQVPRRPGAVVRPATTEQVSAVLAACNAAAVPVTPAGGRSGVCGGAVPAHGGVALDLTALAGLLDVNETSLTADVLAGTFGPDLERALAGRPPGYTAGHWPQSMELSTVGGWLACRGAGQYSTRYGKIEDIVAGVVVVLADGTVVDTRHEAPRAATGPSLTQLFVGSEGALGVITQARLRIHPAPAATAKAAYGFASFADGLDACRRVLRRGATPAVLRLYDQAESERNFSERAHCVLIVLDEADELLLSATMGVVAEEVAGSAVDLDVALVDRWLEHRNDVSALVPLWRGGIVVDTAEVAGPWHLLATLATEVPAALQRVEGTLVASVHQSHAYSDGACLYFTFAGRAEDGDLAWMERYYGEAWRVLTEMVAGQGAAISHHHGIGLNRGPYLAAALGRGFDALRAVKDALDPQGILNPGTLGLPSRFGEVAWP